MIPDRPTTLRAKYAMFRAKREFSLKVPYCPEGRTDNDSVKSCTTRQLRRAGRHIGACPGLNLYSFISVLI